MNPIWLAYFVVATWVTAPKPFQVQFAHATVGQNVELLIDGEKLETTFAGKLTFKDETHTWQSVCAAVRRPVSQGQIFTVVALSSKKVGGNIAKAGNIVARFFNSAQTPEQCAGLQLAVWKAIEDGTADADFSSGRLQARASEAVLGYAIQYYQAIALQGEAVFIQTGGGPGAKTVSGTGQSQLSTTS